MRLRHRGAPRRRADHRPRRAAWALALALVFTPLVAAAARAQGVLVAPPGVFMGDATRGGALELYNPGAEPAEVAISLAFGYPVSDSAGHVALRMLDGDTARASAARWLEAFPRRLTLRPQERQTVRILAHPPAGLPAGEYWARIIVEAKGAHVGLQGEAQGGGIQVGLALTVRTVVGLLYRHGKVETGLAMRDTRVWIDGDSLFVRVRFERSGNAAFIGRVHGTLVDASGKTVARFSEPIAVYYALSPRIATALPPLPPGRYTLRLDVDTDRDDVNRAMLLPIPALHDSASVVVAAR